MKHTTWTSGLLAAVSALAIMGCNPTETKSQTTVPTYELNDSCTVIDDGSRMETDTTWSDGCYYVKRTLRVSSSALLTIAPGTVVFFDTGTGLEIYGGALSAEGTGKPAKPIVFTGKQKTPGYWKGVEFYDTNDNRNKLANVYIRYAVVGLTGGNGTNRIHVTDTTFQHSETYGFYLDGKTIIDQWKNITSTKNKTAGYLDKTNNISKLDESGEYTGNTNDYIQVHWGWLENEGDVTWKKLSVPIFFDEGGNANQLGVDSGSFLTINPGATFMFAENDKFHLATGSGFKILGTEKDPVIFKGKKSKAGYWYGIDIDGSSDPLNEIGYTQIEDAGKVNGSNTGGAIHIHNTSDSVHVHHTTIKKSQGDGINFFLSDPYPDVEIDDKTMTYIEIGQDNIGRD